MDVFAPKLIARVINLISRSLSMTVFVLVRELVMLRSNQAWCGKSRRRVSTAASGRLESLIRGFAARDVDD
jgi:hypothetical protein